MDAGEPHTVGRHRRRGAPADAGGRLGGAAVPAAAAAAAVGDTVVECHGLAAAAAAAAAPRREGRERKRRATDCNGGGGGGVAAATRPPLAGGRGRPAAAAAAVYTADGDVTDGASTCTPTTSPEGEEGAAAAAAVGAMGTGRRACGGAPAVGTAAALAHAGDISVFFSVSPPSVGTAAYIGHVLTHARASSGVAIAAVALLDRAAAVDGRLGLHPLNVHRLVTTAVVVAAKVVDERTYPLAHFARVGGFGGVAELARCERVLLETLGWRLVVTRRDVDET
ncbi:hypothetical protein I4F81_005832 [Pyropia yezoensis]|uniref:Uncharacterized protein n=1 Tax=Pyropia yezoensis TaxID=2788 RepID=A0ACC3BZY9_PYRYE|nr:hypothetical protein I4F81_005832 [Neopyropia yezoensis]